MKNLPQLLLEAERAFDEKFARYLIPQDDSMYFGKGALHNKVKSFLRDTLLSILSEAERATEVGERIVPKDPLDITPREAMKQIVQPIYRPYVSAEESFNSALSEVKSLWREWRGNLK